MNQSYVNNNQIINKIVMVMKVVTVFVELARATMVCDCEYFVFDITPIVIRILLTPVLGFKQTLTPSPHVCSNFALPGGPHSPCQDPPLPQQLSWPLLLTPHLGHAESLHVYHVCMYAYVYVHTNRIFSRIAYTHAWICDLNTHRRTCSHAHKYACKPIYARALYFQTPIQQGIVIAWWLRIAPALPPQPNLSSRGASLPGASVSRE